MTKDQTIERITSYLPQMDEGVLISVLTLLERVQPEDDAWDKQMQADAEAGLLDDLMNTALEEFEKGETEDLLDGLKARREKAT